MCGITAFSGLKDKKTFDESVFRILAMAQDDRGGQGVGIVAKCFREVQDKDSKLSTQLRIVRRIDDRYKKSCEVSQGGHLDLSTFGNLFELWELEPEKRLMGKFAPPYTIVAHARKASVGQVSILNTHPHIAVTPEGYKLIGVHNGTIRDWALEKIAKDLNIDITGLNTDSKILYTIMASSPQNLREVLSRYAGAAALVWLNTEFPDRMHVWVGGETSYSSKVVTQERPLHYMKTKDGIFLSSLETPLEYIVSIKGFQSGYCLDYPEPFDTNTITTIEHGKIVDKEVIERKEETYSYVRPAVTHTNIGNRGKKENEEEKHTKNNYISSALSERDNLPQVYIDKKIKDEKVYVKGGRYFYGKEVLNNVVHFEKLNYPNKASITVDPIYITDKGDVVEKHKTLPNEYAHKGTFQIFLGLDTILEAYFYNGLLLKSKDELIHYHFLAYPSYGAAFIPTLRKSTNMPLWVGVYLENTEGQEIFVAPNAAVGVYDGVYLYPFTKQGAFFKNGLLLEHILDDRYSMFKEALVDSKDGGKDLFCTTCSRVIPGTVDCLTCSAGIYSTEYQSVKETVLKEDQCMVCFSNLSEEDSKVIAMCKPCANTFSTSTPNKLHPMDKLPAVQSKEHELILKLHNADSKEAVCIGCKITSKTAETDDNCDACGYVNGMQVVNKVPKKPKKEEAIDGHEDYKAFFNAWGGAISDIYAGEVKK